MRAGAREVVFLDREPLALQCALLSSAASGVPVSVGSPLSTCDDSGAGKDRSEPAGVQRRGQDRGMSGSAAWSDELTEDMLRQVAPSEKASGYAALACLPLVMVIYCDCTQ